MAEVAVSIVIPARNAGRFIAATLASLRAQSAGDFEAIVIDDGSTDETAATVRQVAEVDDRFRLVSGPEQGVSAARNAGLAEVRGALVLFLDADDLLAADGLERFRAVLDTADGVAALGGVTRISEDGRPLAANDNRPLARQPDQLAALLRKNFVVNGGALMIRAGVARAVGGYDPSLVHGEDWEFWCRIAEQGRILVVEGAPVLFYRQVASGANVRAFGSVLAWNVPCLDRIAARTELQRRYGRRLRRLVRDRRIDIFWSGVRSEYRFGSRPRALAIALIGLALYPDSVARPDLALRFLKTLGR
jgi:glycosyltransferase involved in cell wall biosynthesis